MPNTTERSISAYYKLLTASHRSARQLTLKALGDWFISICISGEIRTLWSFPSFNLKGWGGGVVFWSLMIHIAVATFFWKDKDLYSKVYLHILTTYQMCTVFMFQPTSWENNCLVLCCRLQFSSKTPRDLPWCLALEEFTDCYKSWFLLCQISRGVTQRDLLVPETTVPPVRYIWRDTN